MNGTVTIYCKNNSRPYRVSAGANLRTIYAVCKIERAATSDEQSPKPPTAGELLARPLCAKVNNRVQSLLFKCYEDADIEFLYYDDMSGARTYLRTLFLVLSKVVNEHFPDNHINLEHPVSGGYYCTFAKPVIISPQLAEILTFKMNSVIKVSRPVYSFTVRIDDAVDTLKEHGLRDTALLLQSAGPNYATYCQLDDYVDYFYGCLAPSTDYINIFALQAYNDGLLLRVPQQTDPSKLCPAVPQPKLFDAYKRHLELQKAIGINYVGDLNMEIQKGNAGDIVRICEAMQEKHIAKIAEHIAERYRSFGTKIVLISGPSSSGKTTFCKRLQIQLYTNLLNPVGISLDDYYLNRIDTPEDEEGKPDYESLYAIDLPYFKSDLQRLLSGREVELPVFNFETGEREFTGKKIRLGANSVLVLEGIHGLNPELTDCIPPENLFKIYVSALTTISLDRHNYIPTSDNRLIRRIVRDYQFRGYSAKETIAMWQNVRKGEEKWIFPYQENADETFNSAMIYELAALRRYAEPILAKVLERDEEYAEAYRLLRFLRFFNYIPEGELPKASLLREFLGNGDSDFL